MKKTGRQSGIQAGIQGYYGLLLTASLMVSVVSLYGQQIPLYSQYNENRFLYNPAQTGSKDDMLLHLLYRRQWTDIEGAPETIAGTFEGPIKSKKVGIGAYVYSDKTDIIERLGGQLTYSYFFNMGEDHRLGLGIGVGILQTRLDLQRAEVIQAEDPLLTNGSFQKGLAFDGSVGINYWFKGLSVGFSMPQLVQTELADVKSENPLSYQMARHYLTTASYEIGLADGKFYIEPGVMFRSAKGNPFQVDVLAKFSYKRIVWLSAAYRYDYAVTVGAGVQVHDRVSVGYATDIAVNGISGYTAGTHEIMVGIKFGKRDDQGLIELIKRVERLEESDMKQNERIDGIDNKNTELLNQNESLKNELSEKDAEIAKLKSEMENLIKNYQEEMKRDNPSEAIQDLPKDLVFEANKEDLEFIEGEATGGYFMVVSSQKTEDQAREYAKKLRARGYNVGIVKNKKRSWYYLFLTKPGDLNNGIKELYKLRSETEFKDAWIHIFK